MKKIFNILIPIICIVLFLTACNGNTDVYWSDLLSVDSQIQSQQSAGTVSEIETETQKPIEAVIPEIMVVGRTISANGELTDLKYTDALARLQTILDNYTHNVSLSVCSVDGNKSLFYNTATDIFGACTIKAGYTYYACKQMEAGIGNLQTMMTYESKYYHAGTGDIQYSPYGTQFTMETLLNKSMSISDNAGYLMSVDYFGRDGYNSLMNELGCPSLRISPTIWSLHTQSQDLIKIWCHIYNYFQTETEYSRFLYNSCTNTADNYATAALSDVEYSHKQGHNSTGKWRSYSDAGIVWKEDSPYIIAILTDASGPSEYEEEVFAQIINIVHNELF